MVEMTAASPLAQSPEAAPEQSTARTPELSHSLFVEEVRQERLSFLWKATLLVALILSWLAVLFTETSSETLFSVITTIGVAIVSSLLTRELIRRNRYQTATYVYSVGMSLIVAFLMLPDNDANRQLAPFIGIVVIFISGALMSAWAMFGVLLVSYLFMLGIPLAATGDVVLNGSVVAAFLLMALTALISAQVNGELYGVAEWALESYRKERDTATKLHESRLEVEHSLLKQQGLTLQLRQANTELDKAREAAEIAKQFRGQFLANMSHELRTPLNAIIGFSDTMLNFPLMYGGTELPAEYRKDMGQIFTSGKHLLSIINDILDLSKIDAGRLEVEIQPVDLEPMFRGVLSTAVGLVGGKPVKLLRDTPEPLPMVLADPIRARQVLLNLYSNAAKFTDEGSITLGLLSEPDRVIIAVKDTGCGIAAHQTEVIFEAFRQGEGGRKQQRAGAGLGLAISRQLLQLMNGEIWVESEMGKGSTFYIALPRYYPPGPDADWVEVEGLPDATPLARQRLIGVGEVPPGA
jgi:signal transduction histidine kinase